MRGDARPRGHLLKLAPLAIDDGDKVRVAEVASLNRPDRISSVSAARLFAAIQPGSSMDVRTPRTTSRPTRD